MSARHSTSPLGSSHHRDDLHNTTLTDNQTSGDDDEDDNNDDQFYSPTESPLAFPQPDGSEYPVDNSAASLGSDLPSPLPLPHNARYRLCISNSQRSFSQRPSPILPPHRTAAVSPPYASVNDRYDPHDRYTTSLIQRQQQASTVPRQHLREFSRPSSSAGSVTTHSLRRRARFEDLRPSRLRSSSLESLQPRAPESRSPSPSTRTSERQSRDSSPHSYHQRRSTSAYSSASIPHPALRISRRTHSAILFALEEAIRTPNPFTTDDIEENAQMSDLGGGNGRASNGGARTGGPVPVSGGTPVGIRTPRDVMRDRNAREARRQQEAQREEEQGRQAEERRRSAERRAATVPSSIPRFSGASSRYSQDAIAAAGAHDAGDDRRQSRIPGEVAGTNVLGEPTGRASIDASNSRARGPSMSQPDPQPRTATVGATRRTQPSQTAPRQPTVAANVASSTSQPTGEGARNTASSFPHAFERWETLSSHWEGLTSYWLHKLEQNTEEIRETVPNASTLNRQITDLSAAGANLFHAVVELQRLRASSERKFQRWFFETRADTERSREQQAGLERMLKEEREAREDIARWQSDHAGIVENAKREVSEMRRELMISKDEARRAWEELGRRNLESLDTAQSLKEGRVTVVSGVQVVPYVGHPSRTTSLSQGGRPVTRDGAQAYSTAGMTSMTGDERDYYREQTVSPSQTDPFTDSGRQPPLHHEPGRTSLDDRSNQAYYPTGAGASSSTQYPQNTPDQRAIPISSTEAQRFYRQSEQPSNIPSTNTNAAPRDELRPKVSYDDTLSENETEYVIDSTGNIQHDTQGRPMVYRRPAEGAVHARTTTVRQVSPEESEEDFDTEAAIRREQERYAGQGQREMAIPPEAPNVPTSSSSAGRIQGGAYDSAATTGGGDGGEGSRLPAEGEEQDDGDDEPTPDYEGEGFEGYQQYVPRHHHPTRLSDVLEEEEERSSRRTGEV